MRLVMLTWLLYFMVMGRHRIMDFSVNAGRTSRLKPHHLTWKIAEAERITLFLKGRPHADIAANGLRAMTLAGLGEPARQTIDYFALVTAW